MSNIEDLKSQLSLLIGEYKTIYNNDNPHYEQRAKELLVEMRKIFYEPYQALTEQIQHIIMELKYIGHIKLGYFMRPEVVAGYTLIFPVLSQLRDVNILYEIWSNLKIKQDEIVADFARLYPYANLQRLPETHFWRYIIENGFIFTAEEKADIVKRETQLEEIISALNQLSPNKYRLCVVFNTVRILFD